jgi:hypothetical protein
LIRITAVTASQQQPLAEVRARVVEEWTREREKSLREEYLAELRKKYPVVADENAMALLATAVADGATQ